MKIQHQIQNHKAQHARKGALWKKRKPPAFTLSRRIGSTYYKVNVHFSDQATQSMEDKLLHLIRNETVDIDKNCGERSGDLS